MTGSIDHRSRRRRVGAAVFLLAGCVALAATAGAAPFVPQDPDEILERLPPRAGADWDAIRALHAQLAASPADASAAAALARRYLSLYRGSGDPRLVAYAARALRRWDGDAVPPAEVALERALIAQTEHRFAAARDELSRLVEREPRSPQAWLALAAIDTAQGRYAEAKRSCSRLVLQDAALAGACLASLELAAGDAAAAHRWLGANVDSRSSPDSELAAWLATLAAESAEALGRDDEAERHYAAAFAASGAAPSIYLLTAQADFLLQRGRAAAVVERLESAPPADSVLLRLALAEARLGRADPERIATLRYRLELALTGADVTHAREAAFFALYLDDDATRALPLALANWAAQRERIDARLVLEAAEAAGQPSAAQPVRDWLARSAP
jgi:tetratricopeptide repeat protein